ncbi:MAG TPA: sulfotransferase domain-containing protein [Candidatus Competibacteraceae bacterium]|nr:sulfotransferase domain-containing protein [Candidatus Competibacteraceae bacterium]
MASDAIVPDFFIVGAPKCGTSALWQYLRRHPEVFMPDIKELHFFGSDLNSPSFLRDRERYLGLFAGAWGKKRRGEASVWYLYSERAAREIRQFSPQARIIVMLRNPLEMVHAYHSQRLYNGTEDLFDLKEALRAEADRRLGLRLPHNPHPIVGLYYRQIAKYSAQVERYWAVFGPERVHIILFDDFKRDTQRCFQRTLEFLDLPPLAAEGLGVVNPNREWRSESLRQLVQAPPEPLRTLARCLLPSSELRRKLRRQVRLLATRYRPRERMDTEVEQLLRAEYRDDVARLGALLGRDLPRMWGMA